MEKKFIRLSQVTSFTVNSVGRYQYKRWDEGAKKMVIFEKYAPGFRKMYPVSTDQGILDLGSGNLGSMLEAVLGVKENGLSDLRGAMFEVKNNGKSGLDVRYYFNFRGYTKDIFNDDAEEPPVGAD